LRIIVIVITNGSYSNLLSGELATFLSGRYIEFNIHSLSYPEFLLFRKLPDSETSFQQFLRFGGLPHLARLSQEQDVQTEYLQNIISTIIYKDVVQRFGIRNAIAGYKPEDINKLLENVVYNHLSYYGYYVNTGKSGEMEIDFIAEKKAEKIYIQVAYRLDSPQTIEREFGNLKRIPDNYPKMVVRSDNTITNTSDGIRQVNIREFLLNHNP